LLTLIYINQRKLLYLPSENNYLDDPINFTYNEFFIEVDKNIKIKSWLIEKDLKKYKTILFLHGNAGNLFNRSYKLNRLNELNLNVLIISWRSFSGNQGKPNETNLYGDAKKAVKWLNDKGVETEKIILCFLHASKIAFLSIGLIVCIFITEQKILSFFKIF